MYPPADTTASMSTALRQTRVTLGMPSTVMNKSIGSKSGSACSGTMFNVKNSLTGRSG
jgi:hypothetical protein